MNNQMIKKTNKTQKELVSDSIVFQSLHMLHQRDFSQEILKSKTKIPIFLHNSFTIIHREL